MCSKGESRKAYNKGHCRKMLENQIQTGHSRKPNRGTKPRASRRPNEHTGRPPSPAERHPLRRRTSDNDIHDDFTQPDPRDPRERRQRRQARSAILAVLFWSSGRVTSHFSSHFSRISRSAITPCLNQTRNSRISRHFLALQKFQTRKSSGHWHWSSLY